MNVDELWYGHGTVARFIRAAVSPLSWLYRTGVGTRNLLYDRGAFRAIGATIPVVSVGNISVGGTGKTPFSAYLVRELVAGGHKPAVVMRGYGEDEPHVHRRLNPGVPVITGADRVSGIRAAAAAGADVAILDDGFQHRRAARDLDIVLVSAERWRDDQRLLPAGPLREPPASLARAGLVVVTRKSATDADARAVQSGIRAARGDVNIAIAALEPSALVAASGGDTISLDVLRGETVLAVAGIGDPSSYFEQLRQLGARVTEFRFRDHHEYTASDAARICAGYPGHKYVVSTEKDAVKLGSVWPANGPPLWYLSQAVRITEGSSLVAAALAKLFKRATSIAE